MWLVLDTSGPFCGAGLFNGATAVVERSENIGRGHAERLMPMIEEIMAEAGKGWSDVSAIVVARGPGSFTGLRVGLSAARGFGLALGCPVYGVSVLDALALDHTDGSPFVLAMDAKRGEVWCGAFDSKGQPTRAPWGIAVEAFSKPADIVRVLDLPQTEQTPRLANLLAVAQRNEMPPTHPAALYLRAPDAKKQAPALP